MNAALTRVAIAVLDLDEAMSRYSAISGAVFQRAGPAIEAATGVCAALDLDAGLELVSPASGASSSIAEDLSAFLAKHGEAVYSVTIRPDANASIHGAAEQAVTAGYKVLWGPTQLGETDLATKMGGRFVCFESVSLKHEATDFLLTYNIVQEKL